MNNLKIKKFSAQWCNPCKTLSKVLIPFLEESYPDLELEEIDIEENDEMASSYNIRNIPTLVFLKDNVEVARSVGNKSILEIDKIIKQYI